MTKFFDIDTITKVISHNNPFKYIDDEPFQVSNQTSENWRMVRANSCDP
ncbi:hypothetical protein ACFQ2J_12415 [Thalassobacillus hwangdonensis]|uniref:Cytochrome P450 n=1 Tax=Thalassobacillus hwangdonensis TaxID=546108 RepID=A0ABW3L1N1_9BACI